MNPNEAFSVKQTNHELCFLKFIENPSITPFDNMAAVQKDGSLQTIVSNFVRNECLWKLIKMPLKLLLRFQLTEVKLASHMDRRQSGTTSLPEPMATEVDRRIHATRGSSELTSLCDIEFDNSLVNIDNMSASHSISWWKYKTII